jgi:hypothetical protein
LRPTIAARGYSRGLRRDLDGCSQHDHGADGIGQFYSAGRWRPNAPNALVESHRKLGMFDAIGRVSHTSERPDGVASPIFMVLNDGG